MIKSIIETNETTKPNDREMEVLRRYFPQCFNNEGAFDIDRFKTQIQESVNITQEGYDLNFLGKNYAKLLSSMDTTTIIQPDETHNALPENVNSQNLYISGDNLDALKHLLKSYSGQIKCIYIDPPYNTGTDGFVYNDKFTFTAEELATKLSISEQQASKILDLTRRGSASHSAWLTFMACRLQLARDLLTDDGVIFISIDDNEQANLKLLCDSVFGEENFVANLIWQSTPGSNTGTELKTVTEYILLFAKDKISSKISTLPIDNEDKYVLEDEFVNERGRYVLNKLDRRMTGVHYSEALFYPIEAPDGKLVYPGGNESGNTDNWNFRWSKEKVQWGIENDFIVFLEREGKWSVYFKQYLYVDNNNLPIQRALPRQNLLLVDGANSARGTREAMDIFEKKIFDYPKPLNLIIEVIKHIDYKNDIILDFFSGSATTAQAVMQLNADDKSKKLRYIMVQLPEATPQNSEARRTGYNTIDEIGQERIRRAAAKIKSETGADIDYGFKHYTLLEPSDNTLDKMEEFNPNAIFADETLLDTFGKSAILETWMVRDGYGFGANINPIKLNNYTAYHIDKHLYLTDVEFDEKDMVALIDHYSEDASFCPENIVIFGYSFTFTQTEMLRKNLIILRDGDKNLKINIDIRY